MVAQAIAGNGVQATNYFLGTKYVEALARMGSSNNAKMFFLPVEAAGVMASIAGIGELAREAQARTAGLRVTITSSVWNPPSTIGIRFAEVTR